MNNRESEQLSPNGLVRRIKKQILAQRHNFYAICTPGLESILAAELAAVSDCADCVAERGGVSFSGTIDTMIESSMKLRTANRLLIRIDSFMAKSYPELFNRIKRIAWEPWIGFTQSFDVVVTSRKSKLHHTDNMAESVAEAIETTAAKFGGVAKRSESDPVVTIVIRFDEDRCHVSLDCSGELLYRRGYRVETGFAPVRETIGAGLLLAAGAQTASLMVDPMAGSGTFCIESALMQTNRAPNIHRSFAFEQWPLGPEIEGKLRYIRKKLVEQEIPDRELRILGNDIEPKASLCATHNSARAGCDSIRWSVGDFRAMEIPLVEGKMVVACNPPYGKRVGEDHEIAALYGDLNRWMEQQCAGATAVLLIPEGREKLFHSLKITKTIPLSNGGIDVVALIGMVQKKR